jgi:hypothetical protein
VEYVLRAGRHPSVKALLPAPEAAKLAASTSSSRGKQEMGKLLCRGLVRAVTGRAVLFVLLQTIHEGPFSSMALARCLTQGENHPRMFKAIVYEIFRLDV